MNKPVLHRIIAVFFAIYLPVALIGIPLHKHYCKGELEDIQVFFEAKSCHEVENESHACCADKMNSCHMDDLSNHCGSESKESNECCNHQLELIKADVILIAQNSPEPIIDILAIIIPKSLAITLIKSFQAPLPKIQKDNPPGPYTDGFERLIHHGQFLC